MKHRSSRDLFGYWNERRGSRLAPERGDIDPGAIRHVLPDTFFLTVGARDGHPFRLAGTRVCALFGQELKGRPFQTLWNGLDAPQMGELIGSIASETVGLVAGVTAHTAEGKTADLELLLLPVYDRGRADLQIVGTLAPLAVPYWLGVSAVADLSLNAFRHVGPNIVMVGKQWPPAVRPKLVLHVGGRA
jgi:hypothetical protein